MTASKKPARPRVPKRAMEVGCYQAWFSPITVHEFQLEFVLDRADERNNRPTRAQLQCQGRTFTSYSEALFNMLEKEFKQTKDVRIIERQEYGNISFRIEAPTIKSLERQLERCAKVCSRWVNKYRINEMEKNANGNA